MLLKISFGQVSPQLNIFGESNDFKVPSKFVGESTYKITGIQMNPGLCWSSSDAERNN